MTYQCRDFKADKGEHFSDVMEDPGDWARKAVKEYGANMVQYTLIGTGPKVLGQIAKGRCKGH